MDVSGFPFVNLANNQLVRAISTSTRSSASRGKEQGDYNSNNSILCSHEFISPSNNSIHDAQSFDLNAITSLGKIETLKAPEKSGTNIDAAKVHMNDTANFENISP
jgi:hypothetical protein